MAISQLDDTEQSVSYPFLVLGGVKTTCISRRQLLQRMIGDCRAARRKSLLPKLVFDSNGHALSLAARNASYRHCLEVADIVHADGQPLVFASRLLTRLPIPERTVTTDFFTDAAEVAAKVGLRFYLLGATEDVNARCAEIMASRYPGLCIDRRNGYFTEADEEDICADINCAAPDVVWVGLGKPKEQEFCVRNRHRLKAGWLITCGGCFNYVGGDYGRAPLWLQRAGFEWLYRAATDPKKYAFRYLTTNPHAAFLLLTRTERLPFYQTTSPNAPTELGAAERQST